MGSVLEERPATSDGKTTEPPTLSVAVPNWSADGSVHRGHVTLQVVGTRDDDADLSPVLVVEDAAESVMAKPSESP